MLGKEKTEINDRIYKLTISLEVKRPFKENDGTYKSDIIKIKLYSMISETLKKGMEIAVKGRVVSQNNQIELIGEKVIFIFKEQQF